MTTLHGADVSHYQSGLDLRKSGLDFAIMKATEGTTFVDAHCDTFYQQAKSAGVLRGVYHFYRGNPTAEADFFVDTIGGYVGDALLALDFEDEHYSQDVAGAKAWLDRVHSKTGVRPVIYMNHAFITGANWSSVESADYGLWIARYASETGSISPWKNLALWQYTSSGSVPGYSGNVDLDHFYGDAKAWAAYTGSGSKPAPTPDPAPKPDSDALNVDGYWGKATTKRLQHVLGTSVDGVVSSQIKGDWNAALQSVTWSSAASAVGSRVIAAIQSKLRGWGHYDGATDGNLGPGTIRGMQTHYGTDVDGVISSPSSMVAAMQRSLNAGKF